MARYAGVSSCRFAVQFHSYLLREQLAPATARLHRDSHQVTHAEGNEGPVVEFRPQQLPFRNEFVAQGNCRIPVITQERRYLGSPDVDWSLAGVIVLVTDSSRLRVNQNPPSSGDL